MQSQTIYLETTYPKTWDFAGVAQAKRSKHHFGTP